VIGAKHPALPTHYLADTGKSTTANKKAVRYSA